MGYGLKGVRRAFGATLIAAALGFAVAGCATPTAYAPATREGGEGFSESRIEANRYRVSVRGNSITDRERVEQILLYRAAELTVQNGFDYFVLAGRAADSDTRLSPVGAPLSARWAWYSPRWGWRWWNDPLWSDPVSYREITRFEASAEVAMFKGEKPAGDANAYDARAVQQNLAAVAVAPAR